MGLSQGIESQVGKKQFGHCVLEIYLALFQILQAACALQTINRGLKLQIKVLGNKLVYILLYSNQLAIASQARLYLSPLAGLLFCLGLHVSIARRLYFIYN